MSISDFTKNIRLIATGRDCNITGKINVNYCKSLELFYFKTLTGTADVGVRGIVHAYNSNVLIRSYSADYPTNIVADVSLATYMSCVYCEASTVYLGIETNSDTSYINLIGGYAGIRVYDSSVNIGMNVTIPETTEKGIIIFAGEVNANKSFTNNATTKITNNNRLLSGNDWELIGSVTGGVDNVTIDSSLYTEFYVSLQVYGVRSALVLASSNLTDSNVYYNSGWYKSSSSLGKIQIATSKTGIGIGEVYVDGADCTSISTVTVYGKRC